jgi:hypothetical protein
MKKYAIPSSVYKNQLFSKAVHNKFNSLRAKRPIKGIHFSLPESNFIAG